MPPTIRVDEDHIVIDDQHVLNYEQALALRGSLKAAIDTLEEQRREREREERLISHRPCPECFTPLVVDPNLTNYVCVNPKCLLGGSHLAFPIRLGLRDKTGWIALPKNEQPQCSARRILHVVPSAVDTVIEALAAEGIAARQADDGIEVAQGFEHLKARTYDFVVVNADGSLRIIEQRPAARARLDRAAAKVS